MLKIKEDKMQALDTESKMDINEMQEQIKELKLAFKMASKEAFGNKAGIVVSDYSKRITTSEEYAEYLIWKAKKYLKEK